MNVFTELAEMQKLIFELDTEAAERRYADLCRQHSDRWERISAVSLTGHALDRLFDGYCKAVKASRKHNAAAIYFEYDLDNGWNAHFFVCPSYNALSIGNDDWACDNVSAIGVPGIYEFGKIYKQLGGFCTTESSTAATLHMISRTAQALSEVVERKATCDTTAICIGFHDQDPIHHLRNGG